MDAKVGDWVITPRIGKPVEVQALWLNALRIAGATTLEYGALYRQALASFQLRFWNEQRGCLYDVVDVDHVPGRNDAALRPNQILAVGGLPYQVLVEPYATPRRRRGRAASADAARPALAGARASRATPPHYGGGVRERDSAYHQGTVWPWLIGPFVEAWLRTRGDAPGGEARGGRAVSRAAARASRRRRASATSREIADAEAPHTPRGCPFQAWSLGELLRASRLVRGRRRRRPARRPRARPRRASGA